ncbi:siderophore-iron reductase FhuF [Ensifer sp. Root142]|uniref:siderophore-iron reductase FhuF n=1 Tax=Ensifer sp. Root142 TaxID=1736461 RepID=UPI0009E72323|nr:siderophore-iron reductase FhuF [Ensifer sp. Root142]
MMVNQLPTLPTPFADAALSHAVPTENGNLVSLDSILKPGPIANALDGLLQRWGPGDRRAAASLWTQGYFGRLLRPVIAYGLVHDIWFSLELSDIYVGLSDLETPVRFVLKRAAPAPVSEHLGRIVEDNVKPLIVRMARVTATSERVHWSNASYTLCRACGHVRDLWQQETMPADVAVRLREMEMHMSAVHPLFRLTHMVPDAARGICLQRKVCCIRYKLDGLKKCGTACPINAPTFCRR